MKITGAKVGDSIFFSCDKKQNVLQLMSSTRDKIANELDLIDHNVFAFCWIVDYPMYELDNTTGKLNLVITPFLCHKEMRRI